MYNYDGLIIYPIWVYLMAQPQKNLTRNWNQRLTERTKWLTEQTTHGLLWFDWILANDLTNFWKLQKVLSELKTNEGLVFFPWWIVTWRHGRTDRKSLGRPFGRRSYHHYLEVLAEFDVAEDPERLKSKEDDNLAQFRSCGGPVTKIRQFGLKFDPVACFWRCGGPVTRSFPFLKKNFGQSDPRDCPEGTYSLN